MVTRPTARLDNFPTTTSAAATIITKEGIAEPAAIPNNRIMTINLGLGFFDVVDGKEKMTVWFTDMVLPCLRYKFEPKEILKNTPPISVMYKLFVKQGYSSEEIITKLIEIYLPFKMFRVKEFAKMPLVIGFIGQRGSGKTCGAVAIVVLDWMLRGLPVWSNVPIRIRVVYRDAEKIFTSEPLAKLDFMNIAEGYRGGVALVDEANMEMAEATRFSSGANLDFGYAVQQIRKKQMSVIWTCQGFNWIDNRLRWQTDFLISCRDAFLDHRYKASGIGDKSVWTEHDLSGMTNKFDYSYQIRHRFVTDYKTNERWWWNRPWWNAYNSYEVQGQDNYVTSYKEKKAQAERDKLEKFAQGVIDEFLKTQKDEIEVQEFWQLYNIESLNMKRIITAKMEDAGYLKKQYWDTDEGKRKYHFTRLDDG